MGFFAPVTVDGGGGFKVEKFDLNLWCLPGLFGRYLLFCDVGVRVVAGPGQLTAIGLAVPFGTSERDLTDLVPRMLNDRATASLVFGEDVGEPIGNDGTDYHRLARISISGASLERQRSTGRFSLWRLPLEVPLNEGESRYIRLRLRVRNVSRAWTRRRPVSSPSGVIVDLRVLDLREAAIVPDGGWYKRNVVDIEQLNCFVILPASMLTRRISPTLRYSRLLEGTVWERYLGRATDLRRSGKFVVHFWRSERVTVSREFRGFLDLSGRRRGMVIRALTTWIATLAAVALLLDPAIMDKAPGVSFIRWLNGTEIADYVRSQLPALSVVGIVGAMVTLAGKLGAFKGRFLRLREALLAGERWIYEKRARLGPLE